MSWLWSIPAAADFDRDQLAGASAASAKRASAAGGLRAASGRERRVCTTSLGAVTSLLAAAEDSGLFRAVVAVDPVSDGYQVFLNQGGELTALPYQALAAST